uniref:MATE efflux family protein 1 n=1 Tax=Noccaea caerulescens TaxID=107243 RepID=A0A1J3J8M3_NOCCA
MPVFFELLSLGIGFGFSVGFVKVGSIIELRLILIQSVFKFDELGLEIARIALPAALALTADPIASLVDTAFIGQIGPVELAAVGVSIALFNQVSRIAIFPLVSITTSFVAEEDACSSQQSTVQDHKECIETGIDNTNEETQELIPVNNKGFSNI